MDPEDDIMALRESPHRYQPPPMATNVAARSKVTVDEKVVRKMLAINPALRKGRTTFQVKKALERGESISARQPVALAVANDPAMGVNKVGLATREELEATIDFFVRGKAERWAATRADFAERHRALDEAEAAARLALGSQLTAFMTLLDDRAVAVGGKAALTRHSGLLGELGLTVGSLLAASPRGGR
jgi:hypothetical protein